MDIVKKHFEEEAKEFDQIILKLIPYYEEMIDALVSMIPFDKSESINVIDLGCGTGTISKRIKQEYPNAKITCLDLAENMVEMSQFKLRNFNDIRYQVGDFSDYNFDDSYDVVVSSLALHHLVTDSDKINFYRKVYDSIRPGGVFFNADVILGSNDKLQDVYMSKWKLFMKKTVSEKDIESKWLQNYRDEDRPAKLIDQLKWLEAIGFSDIDIAWKYYNFSVYGGFK
ncbi:class I SAM-dependent methyltransferase [Photobacterium satsumensis]|uniref:class I SAM-dependent methyltransferase n=1 Tax=Photobacterium satsumensis TaxID=2910239 RepID=UPI003D11826F